MRRKNNEINANEMEERGMIVKAKCPKCGKKITFKCYSENRRKAKKEKSEIQITLNILKECRLIHSL
jgi:predicted RNA-binding Zn-ribbon protein involved in translation (DUF1610 family)